MATKKSTTKKKSSGSKDSLQSIKMDLVSVSDRLSKLDYPLDSQKISHGRAIACVSMAITNLNTI